MKVKGLQNRILNALTILIAIALLHGCGATKQLQAQGLDRTILPMPDPEFKGKVERSLL